MLRKVKGDVYFSCGLGFGNGEDLLVPRRIGGRDVGEVEVPWVRGTTETSLERIHMEPSVERTRTRRSPKGDENLTFGFEK